MNNYAKFLSLGFTSFIKNGKITLLEKYGSFLQTDGAISFDESVSRFNTTIVEINEYANKQLGSDTTLGSASELLGKSINESPDLFVEKLDPPGLKKLPLAITDTKPDWISLYSICT